MRTSLAGCWAAVLGIAAATVCSAEPPALERQFASPPDESKAWCYWWWLNGSASKEGITRDFEQMKKQGISGALLFDAGEAGPEAPRGPAFMSTGWRELYKHAVREADRCGIVLGVNLCSGWNAGGPWVTHEHAAKKLVATQTAVKGPGRVTMALQKPAAAQGFYRDVAVLAAPVPQAAAPEFTLHASSQYRDYGPALAQDSVDVTNFMDGNGQLNWEVPPGNWNVLRIGCTLHGNAIKCVGGGPSGLEIDTMSAEAMETHFAETGAKLIADARPLVGKSLQYFHIDSWELGQPTWTPRMREEFQRRRGYDPLPYLPALLGRTVDNAETTRRFVQDYHRTAADLVAANYYGRFRELTLKGGLRGTHPESGGPFFSHWIDALECEGINDVPMGEFWKRNLEPDGPITHSPHTNPSVKQAACAAHIYGKPVCQAEAFTSFADDWIDDPWTMKDIGDEAFCHGLTRNVLCFWVHQPRLDARPGFQWAHVGTHFDCHITWWDMSGAWLTYLARCQHMLKQGLFVADFAYLQPEEVPSFLSPRSQQQPTRPAGFDYDVLNAEVLLSRASAKNGRLTLPDGMSYRYLVLPHQAAPATSPAVLRKLKELADGGVTLIGPKPVAAPTLASFPKCDEEVKRLAEELWKSPRVSYGRSLAEIVKHDGLAPDVEFRQAGANPKAFDWIHRRDGTTEIYFISNQTREPAKGEVVLRVSGKQPELWDAVTGEIRNLSEFREENGRTVVPLEFEPRQSWFVVFRRETTKHTKSTKGAKNFADVKLLAEIAGPWEVAFDAKWGGPEHVTFEKLEDWSKRPEDGIRYYSGTAIYRRAFDLPPPVAGQSPLFLDLGLVKNVARVRLNGRDLGVVWTPPWRVDIRAAVKPRDNQLEIEVVNLWPNRLIGDATLPKEKRFTTTNVRTYDTMSSGTYHCQKCEDRKKTGKPAELLPSGLLGPVTLRVAGRPEAK